uniref:Antimicrobial peptide ISAMP n=1 Tax=Ixodes scapularis TaxID=6945 RepID=ISAMP_IXOSC|nr:RecName: Full=Antimicrobial peptide ISAMP; Flags: Precursor [Ixodes scapularis]AAM93656.1 putative 5.3 kDa secreted protein [Ixodes scapularis]
MRAVAIFIVTLLVLECVYFVMSEPDPGQPWQVKAGRPPCYSIPCRKHDECRVGSCSRCNNGLWGDRTCR